MYQTIAIALLFAFTSQAAFAETAESGAGMPSSKVSESDQNLKGLIDQVRAEAKKLPDIDPETTDKFIRATERLFLRISATALALEQAASKFDESEALEFGALKTNKNKLASLKKWQSITDPYEVAAAAGKKLFDDLPGIFKKELESERLPDKKVAAFVAGFTTAEKMAQAKRLFAQHAKVATSVGRFVRLLIKHEAVWSVDPESEQVESDDEPFSEQFDEALTSVRSEMEELNRQIEAGK